MYGEVVCQLANPYADYSNIVTEFYWDSLFTLSKRYVASMTDGATDRQVGNLVS